MNTNMSFESCKSEQNNEIVINPELWMEKKNETR